MDFKDIKKNMAVKFTTSNEWNDLYGLVKDVVFDTAFIFCPNFPEYTYKITKNNNENDIIKSFIHKVNF